jgi:hypothetical protein
MTGALAGIRVLDFGQYIAGPLAAMLLADQGAEVIRVDPPGGPRWRHPANAVLQRGKRSLVLDLRTAEDRATAARLAAGADVLVVPMDITEAGAVAALAGYEAAPERFSFFNRRAANWVFGQAVAAILGRGGDWAVAAPAAAWAIHAINAADGMRVEA